MSTSVRDNTKQSRFELDVDGRIAFSNYRQADGVLTILHTEVPPELGGRGIGSALVRGVLEIARTKGLKVRPLCPFVKAYMDRHADCADLRM